VWYLSRNNPYDSIAIKSFAVRLNFSVVLEIMKHCWESFYWDNLYKVFFQKYLQNLGLKYLTFYEDQAVFVQLLASRGDV